MTTSRTVIVAATVGLGLVLVPMLTPAPAGAKTKQLKPCALMTPDVLEQVFEQPFRNGRSTGPGACEWHRPDGSHIPDIVVSVLVEKYASIKNAKKGFQHSSGIFAELAGSVKAVDGVGDEAFQTYFIGQDELTVRVGRLVADLRLDRNDKTDATFPEQTPAVAKLLAAGMVAAQP
jgi:hypothetical protein